MRRSAALLSLLVAAYAGQTSRSRGGSRGPPACVRTCRTGRRITCAEFKQFTGPGGCAVSCPAELKAQLSKLFCPQGPQSPRRGNRNRRPETRPQGRPETRPNRRPETRPQRTQRRPQRTERRQRREDGPPACARTCPHDHQPTCDEFKKYTARGGCAGRCPAALKARFHHEFCGNRQPRRRRPRVPARRPMTHCPADSNGPAWCCPSCNCRDRKNDARPCDRDAGTQPRRERRRPNCAITCTEKPKSCAEFKGMTAKGGCAFTCPAEMKAQYEAHFCGRNQNQSQGQGQDRNNRDKRREERDEHRCSREVHHAIAMCGKWIHATCPGITSKDQMGECFIENRSSAPAACEKAAVDAFKCEHEKDSEEECVSEFGEQAKNGCMRDIHRFCKAQMHKGFRPVFECMMRNGKNLSPICLAESRNLVQCVECKNSESKVFDLCMEAFVKVCKGTKEGEEEQCFHRNIDHFSTDCKAAVYGMKGTCSRQEESEKQMDRQNEERHRRQHEKDNNMRREGDVMRKELGDKLVDISSVLDLLY